jgi:hypothetical protein
MACGDDEIRSAEDDASGGAPLSRDADHGGPGGADGAREGAIEDGEGFV